MANLAKLFVTDYASYNEGTQLVFGDWWDLSQYDDAEEFMTAVIEYYKERGKEDIEPMYTDFEGFPEKYYSESMNIDELQKIYDIAEFWGELQSADDDELVRLHNVACQVLGYDDDQIYTFDDEFFDTFFENKPMNAVQAAHFGDLNWGDSYITFDGYGNLKSIADLSNYIDEDRILEAYEDSPREF